MIRTAAKVVFWPVTLWKWLEEPIEEGPGFPSLL